MRLSIFVDSRYSPSSSQEHDRRENVDLIQEIDSKLVSRSPRGGGRGGGGKPAPGGGSGGGGGGGRGGGGGGSGGSGGGSRGGSGGSSGSGGVSRGGVSFGSGSRGSSTYGAGGGSRSIIASGAFAGRPIGGGTRNQVYGDSRYGSGYTYGGGSYVSGRGFPFGYWPVYVPIGAGVGYYGYREYGPADNSSRPGGSMQQALVRSSSWPAANTRRWMLEGRQATNGTNSTTPSSAPINNATASYYIVGDADTVAAVMQELVRACSVVNASGTPVNELNSTVHVEQAVQYYRASSFMLALTSYNNSASLPSNAPLDDNTAAPPSSADTPLPAGTDMNFLNCLNTTIGSSIPIMDSDSYSYSAAPREFQVVGSFNMVGVMWLLIWLLKVF